MTLELTSARAHSQLFIFMKVQMGRGIEKDALDSKSFKSLFFFGIFGK